MSVPAKATMATEDLGKLTVAQLKAICKAKKITAYSKLAKSAIIQKIVDHDLAVSRPGDASYQQPDAVQPVNDASSSQASSPNNVPTTTIHEKSSLVSVISPSFVPVPSSSAAATTNLPTRLANLTVVKRKAILPPLDTKQSKKSRAELPSFRSSEVPMKQRELFPLPALASVARRGTGNPGIFSRTDHCKSRCPIIPDSSTTGLIASAFSVIQAGSSIVPFEPHASFVQAKRTGPKRFVPLLVKRHKKGANIAPLSQNDQPSPATNDPTTHSCLHNLDFPLTPLVVLQPISLPPSLSQRKRVAKIAVALAFVSPGDLHGLTLASRLFRYAAYLSAVYRLMRAFPGRRLTLVLKQYSQNTTNMWPYLRQREEESLSRQRAYQCSFLGKAMGGDAILDRIWTSPDNVKQAIIAVRFLLTRLFFQVSIGHDMNEKMKIIDVQELVEGESWSIKVSSSKGKDVLYVLEATCEVIGHPPPPHVPDQDQEATAPNYLPLRADWSAYISQCLLSSKNTRPPSLMERLKWTNHEEYYRGISKSWLSRTEGEGEIGAAKRLVAERYILACIVSNSVSGRWMSSTEMEQDFNGIPSQVAHARRDNRRDNTLQLFLPAHHHMESLHFTSSDKTPLHPAIAVVQTPGREYYILKDNGMQIGSEEDGIAVVWMQLLGCDALGREPV